MIFVEFRFLFFFAAVFLVHWSLTGRRARKVWLLAASYAFYAAWDWRLLGLLLASTWTDYLAALGIERAMSPRRRRVWLGFSLGVNLGILGLFKYGGFFLESAQALLAWLGLEVSHASLALVLPVGISFYTFQTLSYTLDVYRGTLRPTRDPLDLSLFVAFFPQLVAGPIVRASAFLPQLAAERRFASVDARAMVMLFLVGYFKKACISDNVAVLVDAYFADPGAYSASGAWAAVTMFTVQIYCDFSGYSDMAIACAGLLGFTLPLNFDFPYLRADIRTAWSGWHITLTTWFRDYVFVPLGGARGPALRVVRNTMVTMLLVGLWHGAAWTFVLWGGVHGVGLIVNRAWQRLVPRPPRRSRFGVLGATAVTFTWVCATMILFRSPDLATARVTAGSFLLLRSPGELGFGPGPFLLLAGLAAVHVLASKRVLAAFWERCPTWSFAAACGAFSAVILVSMRGAVQPFLYFQF